VSSHCARSLFLSTSPVKGGDNDKTFEKKIRSQHIAAIAATAKTGGRFCFQNRRPGLGGMPALSEICGKKMRDSV